MPWRHTHNYALMGERLTALFCFFFGGKLARKGQRIEPSLFPVTFTAIANPYLISTNGMGFRLPHRDDFTLVEFARNRWPVSCAELLPCSSIPSVPQNKPDNHDKDYNKVGQSEEGRFHAMSEHETACRQHGITITCRLLDGNQWLGAGGPAGVSSICRNQAIALTENFARAGRQNHDHGGGGRSGRKRRLKLNGSTKKQIVANPAMPTKLTSSSTQLSKYSRPFMYV